MGATVFEISLLNDDWRWQEIIKTINDFMNGYSKEKKKINEPSEVIKEDSNNIQPLDQEPGQGQRVYILWE